MTDIRVRRSRSREARPSVTIARRKRLRVVVADDHELFRRGLTYILERMPWIQVVGEAASGQAALERVRTLQPDVLVVDLAMPDMDGIEVLRELKSRQPGVRCLVLSMHAEEAPVRSAIDMGAAAFVVKESAAEELELALRAISRGAFYMSARVAQFATSANQPAGSGPTHGIGQLTARQREILTLVASGFTTQAIAHQLAISVKTVETHRTQLMDRLGLHDVASLVRFAIREGLISRD